MARTGGTHPDGVADVAEDSAGRSGGGDDGVLFAGMPTNV
jgi:hypothetical protein